MADAELGIQDTFGAKIDVLVEGFTLFLIKILTAKQDAWIGAAPHELDFFSQHPHKKWNNEEQERIDSGTIRNWDSPLCIKWLLEFKWEPHVPKLIPIEREALETLRGIRNKAKHYATSGEAKEPEFLDFCLKVKSALRNLKADEKTITEIVTSAKNRVLADKSVLKKVIRHWDYTTNEVLGSGSFGVVISATHHIDNQTYAVKIIPINESDPPALKNEILLRESRNLAQLDHLNIVKYKATDIYSLSIAKIKDVLQWDSNPKKLGQYIKGAFSICFDSKNTVTMLVIRTEICGETLREWLNLQTTAKEEASNNLREEIGEGLVNALNYIHSKGQIHRDLRPDNIFFAKPHFVPPIKIGDFGLSNQTNQLYEAQTMTKEVGNRLYRAPEINEEHTEGKAKYSQMADWYSLGLVLSEIFEPTKINDLEVKFFKICCNRDTGDRIKGSLWINSVIIQLTEKYPEHRIKKDQRGRVIPIQFMPSVSTERFASPETYRLPGLNARGLPNPYLRGEEHTNTPSKPHRLRICS